MGEETAPEEKIEKKDVTLDFLIDDAGEDRRDDPAGPPVEEKGDHPAIAILDIAVKQSGEFLKTEGLPPANNAVYEHFSKPFLNTALWHYLPDGSIPDDPRVALALGVGGLALAFTPTLLALNQKRTEEEKKEKAKKRREEREEGEETARSPPPVVEEKTAAGPDWLARLGENAGSGLPGM